MQSEFDSRLDNPIQRKVIMNRKQLVKRIEQILNNLDKVCSNKIKAETVVSEFFSFLEQGEKEVEEKRVH